MHSLTHYIHIQHHTLYTHSTSHIHTHTKHRKHLPHAFSQFPPYLQPPVPVGVVGASPPLGDGHERKSPAWQGTINRTTCSHDTLGVFQGKTRGNDDDFVVDNDSGCVYHRNDSSVFLINTTPQTCPGWSCAHSPISTPLSTSKTFIVFGQHGTPCQHIRLILPREFLSNLRHAVMRLIQSCGMSPSCIISAVMKALVKCKDASIIPCCYECCFVRHCFGGGRVRVCGKRGWVPCPPVLSCLCCYEKNSRGQQQQAL